MKKIISVILVLVMSCALAASAFAATGCEASISGATAKAGDEISLSVTVKNSPGIVGGTFSIGYDSNVMTYVDSESTNGMLLVRSSEEAGTNPVRLIFIQTSLQNISGNFSVAKVNFKIKDNAAPGTYNINFSAEEAYNYEEAPISVSVTGSKVVIRSTEPGPGDVNLDGEVTIRDAAFILQHIAGWDVEIDLSFADVDLSGDVTIRDAAKILQYIAGWDVTLGQN